MSPKNEDLEFEEFTGSKPSTKQPKIEDLEFEEFTGSKPSAKHKLNKKQVFEILDRCDNGETYAEVAEDFPVSQNTIYSVNNKVHYKEWVEEWEKQNTPVSGKASRGPQDRNLDKEDVFNILDRFFAGESMVTIARDLPISHQQISKIKRGINYTDYVEEWKDEHEELCEKHNYS